MFGFFFSVVKKIYVFFQMVVGNRHQSLPSTKRDLKNDHNTFSFSRINSPSSVPSAQTATTDQSQNLPPSFNFTKKSNTHSSLCNQPKDNLPRVTVRVDSGVHPKIAPNVHTKPHTVSPLSTCSSSKLPYKAEDVSGSSSSMSSSTLAGISGSTQSPSVSNKPILSRAAPDQLSHLTRTKYSIVEEGSTPLYVIPEDIKGMIKQDIVPRVLKKPLSPETYKDFFAALLYAEDYYLEKWDKFEMKNVILKLQEAEIHGQKGKSKHCNNDKKDDKVFVEFEVDAIPEKRPFLLSRDFASVRPSGRKVDPFQGIIFRVVKSNVVLVEFGDDFHAQHYSSCKYDVKFSFNRACLKRAHQAIAAASDMLFTKFLFPNCRPRYSSYYSTAINRIVNCDESHAYLVEGSLSVTRDKQLSRTGTVVRDAVVRLCKASSLNRILICAPLNSTCDVFMRSLRKEVGDSNIFRANAAFRELDGVPIDILPFCPYKEKEEVFTCPPLSQLLNFNVILSTFMSSYRLHSQGIEGGHFTHIILVDASSAIEPEIMVPLTNLTSVSTKVVVTGSPGNQSGWVRSNIARQNGLRTSYFERLRKSKFYKDLNPEYITQVEADSSLPATSNFR
ncbi:hypothetical protein AgCh_017641 [Apium graveolens]